MRDSLHLCRQSLAPDESPGPFEVDGKPDTRLQRSVGVLEIEALSARIGAFEYAVYVVLTAGLFNLLVKVLCTDNDHLLEVSSLQAERTITTASGTRESRPESRMRSRITPPWVTSR